MKERGPSPPGKATAPHLGTPERRKRVLAKAVLNAAAALDLSQAALAEILGVSEASISRMKDGSYLLGPKEFELAALLVRVFRGLDALMGGHARNLRTWFHADNEHLQGPPALLVRRIEGITRVAQYLDFMRGAQ
jgi:hypothetical protein